MKFAEPMYFCNRMGSSIKLNFSFTFSLLPPRVCFDSNVELFVKMLRQCAQLLDFEAIASLGFQFASCALNASEFLPSVNFFKVNPNFRCNIVVLSPNCL